MVLKSHFIAVFLLLFFLNGNAQESLPLDKSIPYEDSTVAKTKPLHLSVAWSAIQTHLDFLQNPGNPSKQISPLNSVSLEYTFSPLLSGFILFGRGYYSAINPEIPEGFNAQFKRVSAGISMDLLQIIHKARLDKHYQLHARVAYLSDRATVMSQESKIIRTGAVCYALGFQYQLKNQQTLGYVLQVNQQLNGAYWTQLQHSFFVRLPIRFFEGKKTE